MTKIEFVWDDKKDKKNRRKHGIAFNEAKTVFYDENARLLYDPDHSEDEDRFLLLGISYSWRMLLVCHCYEEEDTQICIISARKATKMEQKQYKKFL